MKILHVETGRHLYGGAQQVIYLVRGLNKLGIDDILVCTTDSGLDAAARSAGINVLNLPCAGDHDLGFAFRLRQRLLAERPDIIHCHSRRGGDFLGGLAATGTGIPAVISRRVDNTESPLIAGLRYRPFDRVIAISESIAEVLRASGLDENRLAVIRSAIDTAAFPAAADCTRFREEFGLAATDQVAATIAQLIPRKGHRYLLEAVARIRARYPSLRLIIFGQGPLDAELKQRTQELGIGRIVQFAGFRPDLDGFLPCMDLVIHPAVAEGLGVAALKASAAAVPVIAFAAGGLPEAVIDNETGILVEPGDSDALANGMARLLDHPELRRRYGDAGRALMQRDFSVDAMVAAHVQLYEGILRDRT
jgi:glycosyltransferase involved in cell wall biosynthesis